jgi:transcriptional regulator with XRE-family HTH domain
MAADDTLRQIARVLRDERKDRGLTQQEFAALLGVSRPYVSGLESGRGTTQLRRLIQALNAIGVDLVAERRQ